MITRPSNAIHFNLRNWRCNEGIERDNVDWTFLLTSTQQIPFDLIGFHLFLFFKAVQLAICLHLVHVEIPEYGDIRDVVTLSCSYKMGNKTLNSVKWYKDNQEFFRWANLSCHENRLLNFVLDTRHWWSSKYQHGQSMASIYIERILLDATSRHVVLV